MTGVRSKLTPVFYFPSPLSTACTHFQAAGLGDSVNGSLAHALSYAALVDPHSVSASPSHL
ncbi:hypothetical protein, partial [Mesorhizobium sp. B3-1-7]|uniref:hypothetical protein n=1 Tax=Mesorhizobium sp. B3-1-7 TaxID=2589894 RepID=UPI001AEED0EB